MNMKGTITLNETQATQLFALLDAGEEFYIDTGRGTLLQLRNPSDHGTWDMIISDSSGA